MYREENLTIDLKVKEYNPIHLKQMDTTKLKIKLTDNGLCVDLTNLNVYIIFMKPNKTIVMQSSDIVKDNNVINITLLEDCLRMAGKANMEVELKEDTSVVSSFSIPIVIETTAKENVHSNNTPNYIETLEEAILLEERRKIAEDLRQEAEEKRQIAEISRNENEIERNSKEEDRVSAENIRKESEEQREENEKIRIANEVDRINAENARKINEEQRVMAENLREQQFEEIKENGLNTEKIFNLIYPVGSIYMSITDVNPNTLFGGTWERWGKGKTLVGVDEDDKDFATSEAVGGEKKHTLTLAEMPEHTHIFTGNAHTHAYIKSNTETGSTALTIAQIPEHSHNLTMYSTSSDVSGWGLNNVNYTKKGSTEFIASTGGGQGHTHTIGITSANTEESVATGTNASTGGGQEHNNMQPYITCYMWKRTA